MTDRERWTVYPLLFLALGITVKDKLVRFADFESVRCNSLVVTDRGGKDRVLIGSNPAGGIIQLQGDRDVRGILFGYVNNVAGLMYIDPQGNPGRWLVIPTVAPHKPAPNTPLPAKPAATDEAAAGDEPGKADPLPQAEPNQPEPNQSPTTQPEPGSDSTRDRPDKEV